MNHSNSARNEKAKSTACWIVAALILMLLTGCSSLPVKNSTMALADSTDSKFADNGASANFSSSAGDINSTNSRSFDDEINYPSVDHASLSSSSKLILNKTVKTNLYKIRYLKTGK